MTQWSRVRVPVRAYARLAQMVERTAFNRMVTGSSPVVGNLYRVRIMEIRPLFMRENPGSTPGHDTLF